MILAERKSGTPVLSAFTCALGLLVGACGSDKSLVIGRQALPARCAADPAATEFCLVFADDFERLDPSIWRLASHSFEENLANFAAENAVIQDGKLVLSVTATTPDSVPPEAGAPKAYLAAEVGTVGTFKYGRFRAYARFASGDGVVSSLFGFHDFFEAGAPDSLEWNNITIESSNPLLRLLANTRDPTWPMQKRVDAIAEEPGFDATSGFHWYGFDWTPDYVRFLVDGAVYGSLAPELVGKLSFPKRLVMNTYPSSEAWHPAFDASDLPVAAEYDRVEIYEYIAAGADAATP